ncbi:hypothetical protein EYR40_001658 [Pleurotus pulmonarius]|nr:hypothetical protein EYR40_001658 [Pleurotus pulmonarius]
MSELVRSSGEAEHLSFPLQPEPKIATSNLELAARFKPKTELESAISTLSQRTHLREEDVAETEELTVEEVAARRAELRKMRELIYRAELEDIASTISQARHIGDCGARRTGWTELRLKEDDRARERATLRHKHTGEVDEVDGRKPSVEKLKRKIQGQDSDSEQDDESDKDEEDVNGDPTKARAFEELAHLRDDPLVPSGKARGVSETKFMKDAMARDSTKADRERDDFIREPGETLA